MARLLFSSDCYPSAKVDQQVFSGASGFCAGSDSAPAPSRLSDTVLANPLRAPLPSSLLLIVMTNPHGVWMILKLEGAAFLRPTILPLCSSIIDVVLCGGAVFPLRSFVVDV